MIYWLVSFKTFTTATLQISPDLKKMDMFFSVNQMQEK